MKTEECMGKYNSDDGVSLWVEILFLRIIPRALGILLRYFTRTLPEIIMDFNVRFQTHVQSSIENTVLSGTENTLRVSRLSVFLQLVTISSVKFESLLSTVNNS